MTTILNNDTQTTAIKESAMSESLPSEIYEKMNRKVLKHPAFVKALAKVEDCRLMSKRSREPECMIILGHTGVGKTTIKDHYLSLHPRTETKTGTIIPVVAATIPVPAKLRSIATTLLAALGDPFPEQGHADTRTRRLYKLIKECKVELIFLDEFHHFIDPDKDKVLLEVSDWLKNLITETKVSVVLTGLPSAKAVLERNEQLARRFSCQLNLRPFKWRKPDQRSFRKFLAHLEQSMPVNSSIRFSDEMIAKRFYYASKRGYIAYLLKIAKGAVFIAANKGLKEITLDTLYHAYEERLLTKDNANQGSDDKTNPFHPDWVPPPAIQTFTNPLQQPTQITRAQARRDVASVLS